MIRRNPKTGPGAGHHEQYLDALLGAIDGAPLIVWTTDRNGIVTSSRGRGIYRQGMTGEHVVGRSIFDIYSEHPEIGEYVRRALAGESVRFTLETFGGVYERHIQPIRGDASEIQGVVGLSIDITDKIAAQATSYRSRKAQDSSERKFRDLVEGSLQGIAVIQDRRLVFCNTALLRLHGFDGHQFSSHQDRRAVRQKLHVREHMGREQNRPAAPLGLPDEFT